MVENGVYAFYAGDVNQDENIDMLDASQEEDDISNFEYSYFITDVNGNGNVDLLDIPMLDYNGSQFIFSNHPLRNPYHKKRTGRLAYLYLWDINKESTNELPDVYLFGHLRE